MEFHVQRNDIVRALQSVIGVVERRQTMPILSNVLLLVRDNTLTLTATDLELELIARCPAAAGGNGAIALPARKLLDICRRLGDEAEITFVQEQNVMRVQEGRARFSLATMSADDWPYLDEIKEQRVIVLAQATLRQLLDRTHFAMAHQDVRYYLNGLLLVLSSERIRCVATDGHRLALSEAGITAELEDPLQAIVPRKAVVELIRLLGQDDIEINVQVSNRHLRIELVNITLTTKLIDGRFPDYERVIPEETHHHLRAPRETVYQALARTAVLSNENFGGVRLALSGQTLTLQAQNVDREQAEDSVAVEYDGDDLEIGFSIKYLQDALGAMSSDEFTLDLVGADSSGLLQAVGDSSTRYVVMPMRL